VVVVQAPVVVATADQTNQSTNQSFL